MIKLLSITILVLIPLSVSIAELYKWTDKNGKVHYADQSPDENLTPLDLNELPSLNQLPPPPPAPNTPHKSTNNLIPDYGEYRSNRHSISGRLLFDGKLLEVSAKKDVSIWLRDEGTGKSANIKVDYDVRKGSIYVENLPPGKYGMSININSNKNNPRLYPGDYRSWANFVIRRGYSIKRDLAMIKIIHLSEPQDNNEIIKKWSSPCGKKIALSSPITFRWKSLGKDVKYNYRIRNNICKPFKLAELVEYGETTDTFVTLKLPASKRNHQYMMTITAIRHNRQIGSLMTHGDTGYGWDYRFNVR